MRLRLLKTPFRIFVLTAAVVTFAAIGLGRANPVRVPRRVASPPSYQVLGHDVTGLYGGTPLLLDGDGGRLEALPVPSGLSIDKASVSPWAEDGRRQVAAVCWSRSGTGGSSRCADYGFVRLNLPDGEVLDRIFVDEQTLPRTPPCWIPDAPASVLFAGGDHRLYRVDFDPPRQVVDEDGLGPRALGWQAAVFGGGEVLFMDVAWPDDPRLAGRALATLCVKDGRTGRFTDREVWWLRLDRDGESIVAAGRLLEPTLGNAPAMPRLPNLVRSANGAAILAYLSPSPGRPDYRLLVAPIQFNADSGAPRAREADSRILAEGCLPTRPATSMDGRWMTVVHPSGPNLNAQRIEISIDAAAAESRRL